MLNLSTEWAVSADSSRGCCTCSLSSTFAVGEESDQAGQVTIRNVDKVAAPLNAPGVALQPGTTVRSDAQVYKAMVGALPEGIAAGDYTTAAENKPALAVTESTAKSWGGTDLTAVPQHCDGLVIGSIIGASTPSAVGSCRLPTAREFPDDATLFAALQDQTVTAAWTTSTDPGVPADLVVLTDGKQALVQAENVVPLYRRNELTDRQLLAVNEVAGVLDTAALVEMRRQVTAGADPQVVADGWLGEHPLGR